MKKDNEYSCEELTNISHALIDFVRASENMDNMLTEAVESGMDIGRLVGLFEAYDYLIDAGYAKAAVSLKKHIDEANPPPSTAKA